MKTMFVSVMLGLAAPVLSAATFVVTTDPVQLPQAKFVESFAFSTDSAPLIADIRARITSGQPINPTIKVAGGADGVNRNYLVSGAPAWNWHVEEVTSLSQGGIPEDQSTQSLQDMSDAIALAGDESHMAQYRNTLWLRKLTRIYEITPDNPGKLVNISNRGVLGTGSKVLIGGFIVQGTTPRLVLVRGLGPSLTPLGVDGAASDPRIWLYRGGTLVATNDDWQTAPRTDSIPAGFAPGNAKEAAIVAVLEPGVYSVHGSSADQGVGLLEMFDLSAMR